MTSAQSNESQLTYRLADESDCEDIYKWENDVATRAMSVNTGLFSYVSHVEWYRKSLSNSNRFMYIGLNHLQRVAFIRFDFVSAGTYESGIILNPAMRGKGIGANTLMSAIAIFLQKNRHVDVITASIRNSNIPSKKCFEKSGFIFYKNNGEYCLYDLTIKPTQ